MSGPKLAKTTSKGRTYQHPLTGEGVWSVTTILDALPKKALIGWAAKSVAEYAVANRPALDAILSGVTIRKLPDGTRIVSDPDKVQAAVDYLKGSPYRQRDRKSDLGTLVHGYVESYILGTPRPEVPEDAAPHMGHFARFVETWQPEFLASEVTVWNRTESYAGTLDFIANVGGRTIIWDVKTGKDAYPEVALQLCAYWHGEFSVLPDGTESPLPDIDGAAVLHLTEDGYRVLPIHIDAKTWDTFRYVREVFRWEDDLSKKAIGEALAGPAQLAGLGGLFQAEAA